MRLGLSSYNYTRLLDAGALDLLGVVDRVADSPAEVLELALADDRLLAEPALAAAVAARAADRGVAIESYLIAADLREGGRAGVERVLRHVDAAHALGARILRHDVAPWAWREAGQGEYDRVFATVVASCREIAEHAAGLGMTTTVENHGFFLNGADRVRQMVDAVDHPAFRVTLDAGNGLCVGELPGRTVGQLIDLAAVVHVKDFRIRRDRPGPDWLETLAGEYLLGTVAGSGDIDLAHVIGLVKGSGFDGTLTLEFEGPEDVDAACAAGLATIARLWEGAL